MNIETDNTKYFDGVIANYPNCSNRIILEVKEQLVTFPTRLNLKLECVLSVHSDINHSYYKARNINKLFGLNDNFVDHVTCRNYLLFRYCSSTSEAKDHIESIIDFIQLSFPNTDIRLNIPDKFQKTTDKREYYYSGGRRAGRTQRQRDDYFGDFDEIINNLFKNR